jgi:hypothetical protein
MTTADLLTRLDTLIVEGEAVRAANQADSHAQRLLDHAGFAAFRTASLSFLLRVFGSSHPCYVGFDEHSIDNLVSIDSCVAILRSVRADMLSGGLQTMRGLIAAEMFSDFMEMALHLLNEGYKDPSAVIIGSVLEEHLRQLAAAHSVPITQVTARGTSPKKADLLNADLYKAGVYGKPDHSAISSWLAVRNKAAHGEYSAYNTDQVRNLHTAVREFMDRVTP